LEKKRCGERNNRRKFWKKERCGREIAGENFEKRAKKTWEENFG
jgi:hypothetical protein